MARFTIRGTALPPTFHNTSAYFGKIKNDLRDGEGVYIYKNKFFRYEGEWHEGKKQRRGKLIMADGSFYEGDFHDGEIIGKGLRYWAATNNRYEGDFVKGECHGRGHISYGKGGSYDGDFVLNIREGLGVLVSPEGHVYKGEFHANRKHGEGIQQYADGSVFEGNWVADCRHGRGKLTFPDNSYYEGQWLGDRKHGEGTYMHKSGYVYRGLWVAGMPSPAAKTFKISVVGHEIDGTEWLSSPRSAHEIMGDMPLQLLISVCDEDGNVVKAESGRKIQIVCGIRAPKSPLPSGTLLDAIEDSSLQPMQTPLGFDILPYPFSTVDPKLLMQSSMDGMQQLAVPGSIPSTVSGSDIVSQSQATSQSTTVSHSTNQSLNQSHSSVNASSVSDSATIVPPAVVHTVMPPTQTVEDVIQDGEVTIPPLYLYPSNDSRIFAALENDVQLARTGGDVQQAEAAAGKRQKQSPTNADPDVDPTMLFGKPDPKSGLRPGRYIFLIRDITTDHMGDGACLPEFCGVPRLQTTCFVLTVNAPVMQKPPAKSKKT